MISCLFIQFWVWGACIARRRREFFDISHSRNTFSYVKFCRNYIIWKSIMARCLQGIPLPTGFRPPSAPPPPPPLPTGFRPSAAPPPGHHLSPPVGCSAVSDQILEKPNYSLPPRLVLCLLSLKHSPNVFLWCLLARKPFIPCISCDFAKL